MSDRAATAHSMEIRLFGPFEVCLVDGPLPPLRSRKGQWLLALLALRAGRSVERAWLVATLWPDSPEPAALANLRTSLTDLRRALGTAAHRLHTPTPQTLALNLDGAQVDLLDFDAAIARGDPLSLEHAVALYQGPFLASCTEPWAFEQRQPREEAYLTALETLATRALSHGDPATAERYLRRAVATDPLREPAQRALMQALAAAGSYPAAFQVYRDLRALLHRELNTEPDPETRALFESLRAHARSGEATTSVSRPLSDPASGATPFRDERRSTVAPATAGDLEPVGGAVPLDSPFYVVRPADGEFRQAMARRDSIVLVKGAREVGKTSLLGRGLHHARQVGARVARTDLQSLTPAHLESADLLLQRLAHSVADQLELGLPPEETWDPRRGPGENLTRYWRRVVFRSVDAPIVWALDEVDRLFTYPFATEVFGLFRSWHNDRVLDPGGPWRRLTLAIAYATEAHLFVTDIHQSPFNVGTRLTLEDFTLAGVADLNGRYGSPLATDAELARFAHLVGGHPYLVRRGLHEMVAHGLDLATIEARSHRDDGPFGDHLRRMLVALQRDPELCAAVQEILAGKPCPGLDAFYRLRTAGVIAGEAPEEARPRCRLYASYLSRHLQ